MKRALVLVCLLSFGASACSGGDDGTPKGGVEMTPGQAFEPKTVTISVGETLTWNNESAEQHTVTAEEDSLPSGAGYFASGGASGEDDADDDLSAGLVGPGESYSHTFDTPGTYLYYCIPHRSGGMVGTVVVEAAR